jgi:hypothetical protein
MLVHHVTFSRFDIARAVDANGSPMNNVLHLLVPPVVHFVKVCACSQYWKCDAIVLSAHFFSSVYVVCVWSYSSLLLQLPLQGIRRGSIQK